MSKFHEEEASGERTEAGVSAKALRSLLTPWLGIAEWGGVAGRGGRADGRVLGVKT